MAAGEVSLFTPEARARLQAATRQRAAGLSLAAGAEEEMRQIAGCALARALRAGGWRAAVWGSGYALRAPAGVERELHEVLTACHLLVGPHASDVVKIGAHYCEIHVDDGEVFVGAACADAQEFGDFARSFPELDVSEWEEQARATVLADLDEKLGAARSKVEQLLGERARWARVA